MAKDWDIRDVIRRYLSTLIHQSISEWTMNINDHNPGSQTSRLNYASKKKSTVELGLTLGQGGDQEALHAVSLSTVQSSVMVPNTASTATKLLWRES